VREKGLAGTFWPSRRTRLVLLTALAEPERALEAWRELRPDLDLQTIEDTAFTALPLVYRRLEEAGVDDPDLPRLKGIYRNTWVRNTLLLERLRETVDACRSAELPVLLVGSIGAAVRHYDTLGLRPTGYLELLVPEEGLLRAVRALGGAGWSTRGRSRSERAAPLVLYDDGGVLCLLRTRLAPDFVAPDAQAEAPFWAGARDVDLSGIRVRALAPGDDLLAAIVCGARASPIPSIQWIVDAAMILRGSEEVDWTRLCRLAVERGQGLRVRDALEYVGRVAGRRAAPEVVDLLDAWRPSRRERIVHACTARRVPWLGSFPQAVGEHLAATAGRSSLATAAAFPAFLRERWGVKRAWQLPIAGGRRAVRNLVRGRTG